MSVLVVGELCADIVVPLTGDIPFGQAETIVPETRIVMGGSSAISACGLARLGVTTSLVSVVGDDLLGRFLLDELRSRRVNTSHVRLDDTRSTGSSTILTRPDGDRAILTALGSIGEVTVADATPALADVRHVHVGSYFLQYALHDHLAGWFARLREAGITTSLDPNDDPSGMWDAGIREVLPHTDVFFCNDAEAHAIAGRDPVTTFTQRLPSEGVLVLKQGAAGATLHRPDGAPVSAAPPEDPRPLVDTVGAGDSLTAGFLAARDRGMDDAAALRIGVRNATASTRGVGGTTDQLTWDEAAAG